MTSYTITVAGADVSSRVRPWLIDLSVTDKAGTTSDQASLSLNDANGQLAIPASRSPMTITLNGVPVFTGFVDDVRSEGDRRSGRILTIDAKGLDTGGAAKEPKEKHWDDAPLGSVLNEAGQEAGLSGVQVHGEFAGLARDYWVMDGESFIAFGRRLARELGATFKIFGNTAAFVPRGIGLSATGLALAPVSATWGDNLIGWSLAPRLSRPAFAQVAGRWYDLIEARYKTETGGAGAGEANFDVPETLADADTAGRAAGSEADASDRQTGGGTVEIVGNPMAMAEAPCIVSGARTGIDGAWRIDGVTHRLARGGGFVTTLDLAQPDI